MVSPGVIVESSTVYGPHASTHDLPSPRHYAAYNRMLLDNPHWSLRLLAAWPIILILHFIFCMFSVVHFECLIDVDMAYNRSALVCVNLVHAGSDDYQQRQSEFFGRHDLLVFFAPLNNFSLYSAHRQGSTHPVNLPSPWNCCEKDFRA